WLWLPQAQRGAGRGGVECRRQAEGSIRRRRRQRHRGRLPRDCQALGLQERAVRRARRTKENRMKTIKTTLHYESFNLNRPDERAAYEARCARLNEAGMKDKYMKCLSLPSNVTGAMEYRTVLRGLDGREVELETKHLFNNQWN